MRKHAAMLYAVVARGCAKMYEVVASLVESRLVVRQCMGPVRHHTRRLAHWVGFALRKMVVVGKLAPHRTVFGAAHQPLLAAI